jgi:hypothetical protein
VTLRHIGEVIQPPEKCLILTDSLSSVKAMLSRKISHQTHPLVYECKQMCSDLLEVGVVTCGSRVTRLRTNRHDMRH